MAGVKAQKHFNALEMAMMTHQKTGGQAVNMGLGDEIAREAGADMAAEMDDWMLLEKMAKEQAFSKRSIFSRRPDRIVYQGSELSIDRSSKRASGDPLLLMPGVSMELTGTVMEPTESQAGKKRQEFQGNSGYMVLIPQGSENAAIMPVQEVVVSNRSIRAVGARKEGSKSAGVTFLEPEKRYVFARRLELKDQTIDLMEASQYTISEGKWEEVEGISITASGISEGTVVGRKEPAEQAETMEEPAAGPAVPAPSFILPEAPILVKGFKIPSGMIKNHELLPEAGAVMGTPYNFQDATLHIELNGWPNIPQDQAVTGMHLQTGWGDDGSGEYMVAGTLAIPLDAKTCVRISNLRFDKNQNIWLVDWIKEQELEGAAEDEGEAEEEAEKEEEEDAKKIDPEEVARAILSDLKNGLSLAEIKEKYKGLYEAESSGNSEEKEDGTLFKHESKKTAGFPIVPGISIGIGLEASILLDKFVNKPDLSQKGNPLELSAGLLGSCSLSLRGSLDAEIPYLFSIGGGITGTLSVAGKGDNQELIKGSASASMGVEKNKDTGKYHFVMSEPPMIEFTAGIKLTGSVGADITASSKVFGWSTNLYEVEFGTWEIASVTGVAQLQKQDTDFYHMLRNWKLTQASLNVAVFGEEIYEKSMKSNYGLTETKELVRNREEYNKEQYGILLEKLQQFLSHSGQQVLIGTDSESKGLQSMVQQAMNLKNAAMLQLELEHTALQVNINETDRLLADKGQRKDRADSQKAIEKHQARIQKLEENPENAEATRGYRNARLEELKKEHLFGTGSRQALAFYQKKQQEEAQKDILNTDADFQNALQAGIADPQFIRNFLEKKLKLSKREIIAHYATLDDIQKYEEVRKKSYLDAAMQKAKKKTPEATLKSVIKKGDYSWLRTGGADKILAYEQAEAQKEALSNQKGVKKLEAEGLTKSTEKTHLLANSRQELIDTYREILQPNSQNLQKQYSEVLKGLTKTQGGEPARFSSTIRECLTLEMLLNYEQIRQREASAKQREKHQKRIDRLKWYIAQRNSQQENGSEDEVQATEKAGVEWYLTEASRVMNQLRRNEITVPGLKYAVVAHEAEERMEDEWIRKLQTAPEGDAVALLNLQLPPDLEKKLGDALYQKRQREQAEGRLDLTGYRQAKKLELFRGKKTYSHTERYQELFRYWEDHGKENVNPDFFVQKYLSLGGGAGYASQFDYSSLTWEAVNEFLSLSYENDEGYTKHQERLNELDGMKGTSSEEEIVAHYLEMISKLPFGENFITTKFDTVLSRITPAQIIEREKRDNQYDGIVKFLSDYSVEKQRQEAETDSSKEAKDRAYEEYKRIFMDDHHGYLKSKSKEIKAQANAPVSAEQLQNYEAGRLQEYEARMEELDSSKKQFQETAAAITKRITELNAQVKTLDEIIKDPKTFLKTSGSLPDDHPLVSAKDDIGAETKPVFVEV